MTQSVVKISITVLFRAISISEDRNEYGLLRVKSVNDNSKNKTCVRMYTAFNTMQTSVKTLKAR